MKKIIIKAKNIIEGISNASTLHSLPSDIQAVINQRRSICNDCPLKTTKLGMSACSKCGCFIEAKTASLRESCPLSKWNPYQPTNNTK